MAVAIAPSTSSSWDDDDDVVYELACRRALPSLDGRKCIKHVLLRPRALRRFNYVLHHTKRVFPLLYAIALPSGIIALLMPGTTPTGLSVLSLLLAMPSHVAAFLALRYGMVVLVCKTFEFWYATVMNVICMALISCTLNDVRALVAVSSAVAHQIPFFIDAVYRAPSVAIVASVYGAVVNTIYVVMMIFRLIPNTRHVVLVTVLDRQLTSSVVIANGLLTIALLLARNAYRKYQIMKKFRKDTTGRVVGSSIAYRCCVQLRPINQPRNESNTASTPPHHPGSHTIQLVFDGLDKRFSARNVILPASLVRISLRPWSLGSQTLLNLVGLTGLTALAISHLPQVLVPDFGHHTEISLTAFIGTVGFVSVYLAHCQRQLLLRELGRSFDFLFIFSQSLLAHLCVCELYKWDIRCFGVASSFIWSQWVIILDAVTPVMRQKLAFRKSTAITVGSVLVFEQVSFVLDLVVFGSLKLHERELFSFSLRGREISVTVLPIFLGRVMLTFLWYSRVAWRVFERKENELLVLQGQLQYEDREMRRRAATAGGPRPSLATMLGSSWRSTSMAISSEGSRRGPTLKSLMQN